MFDRAPTLAINDEAFLSDWFERRYAEFDGLPHLARCAGRRYAVCVKHPADWIALCLYFRQHGASVAPLHPNTPLDAAKRAARRLGCEQLLFQRADTSIPIDGSTRDSRSVLILTSSGTTGEPKLVERSWDSVETEVRAYNDALGSASDTAPLLACPVTHSYGFISGVLASFARGVAPVVLANINPKYVIRRALEPETALLYASPTLINVIVRLLSPGQKLCAVMTSGAPLPARWFKELHARSERVLAQYGCSEVGCISLATRLETEDEIGTPLAHLSVSAGMAREKPDEIRVLVEGRIVETRDLGYFGARGLRFVARMDDTINVAGVNVYPREVEEVVLEFSGIAEAAVYKRPDAYAGERVCVKFVATERVDAAELRRFCAQSLSPFALPLELEQVPSLPRLENGKLDRRALLQPRPAEASGHTDP
jgi:acyl-coenzyme A synthetase/AMP-(fatty) acid ligase